MLPLAGVRGVVGGSGRVWHLLVVYMGSLSVYRSLRKCRSCVLLLLLSSPAAVSPTTSSSSAALRFQLLETSSSDLEDLG